MATVIEGKDSNCNYINKSNQSEIDGKSILTDTPKDLTFLAVTCQPGQVTDLEHAVSVQTDVGSGSGGGAGKDDDADCFILTLCCCVCLLACCAVCCGDD